MKVVRSIIEMRTEVKQLRKQRSTIDHEATVGLVPTMGFLHDGHASLMQKATEMSDIVAISIFVNPIQFGPNEDFERYPRDEKRDLALAEKNGVDLVFMPDVEDMYPTPIKTHVTVADLTDTLCGASRPGHFDGVSTVVTKLFNIVKPDYAFFGTKDAQQVAVLRQMVTDLNMDVDIVPCPIVREQDGLALSSRNVYLSREEREQALVLSRSLNNVQQQIRDQEDMTAVQVREFLRTSIAQSTIAEVDYADILSFPRLESLAEHTVLAELDHEVIIALAVKFGRTRLIDNVILEAKGVALHV
ncbi:Pantoate--beta-alanine ligase (AMP-forming) [Paenibacillus nuruki]|uniref:Pantothenate synthetase n=1 Tax=Paenibacillus nuruki TaxID=1886670 RepID=A0A1E3L2T3_9BACL|nr:pantoate--beta-alanine ligase [Paenibacillus nuruki]ODP28117.1 Pantoate--beta-alanine ligase (AMP-forming) [Paenibacillus nuruki]